MAMPEALVRDWERLNERNQAQARPYIRALLREQLNEQPRENPPRRLGVLSERFHGMAEDFNDPLSEFEEYMP